MTLIVVIDDSASILDMARTILVEAGHTAVVFSSGRPALEYLGTVTPDAIVTDIYMPDADGLEVIQEVCRLWRSIPIVAMSGAVGRMCMLRAAKTLGAACVLRKPFSKRTLLSAVEDVLAQRHGTHPGAAGCSPQ